MDEVALIFLLAECDASIFRKNQGWFADLNRVKD